MAAKREHKESNTESDPGRLVVDRDDSSIRTAPPRPEEDETEEVGRPEVDSTGRAAQYSTTQPPHLPHQETTKIQGEESRQASLQADARELATRAMQLIRELAGLQAAFSGHHGFTAYQELKKHLLDLGTDFRRLQATLLEPLFNETIAKLPTDTYEDKQAFCKTVNSELNDLGLAVKCPFTGKAARLVAGTGGNPKKGRFEFISYSEDGKKVTRTSATLPDHLELVPARAGRLPGWTAADMLTPPPSHDE
jgi:hypothetical protein